MAFAPLAAAFRINVMEAVIRAMVSAKFIELPDGEAPDALIDGLWEIGFLVLVQLDEGGGYDGGAGPHWAHLVFTPRGNSVAQGPVLSDPSRVILHGGLVYEEIEAAVKRVQARP